MQLGNIMNVVNKELDYQDKLLNHDIQLIKTELEFIKK